MKTKKFALINYIITLILVATGMISFITVFLGTFDADVYISIGFAAFISIIFAAVFIYIFSLIKRSYIPFLILLLLAGIYFYICRDTIIAGFCVFSNDLIDVVYTYFGIDGLYFIVTNRMWRIANEAQMLYFVIIVLTLIYSFCLAKFRAVAIPLVVSLLALSVPLATEQTESAMTIIISVVFALEMVAILISSKHRRKSAGNRYTTLLATVIMGAFITLTGLITTTIIDANDYERPEFWLDFKDWTVATGNRLADSLHIGDGGQTVETGKGMISAGDLSNTGNLNFKGEEVLRAYFSVAPTGTVYLAGFRGENFTDRRWTELDAREEAEYGIRTEMLASMYARDISFAELVFNNNNILNGVEDLTNSGFTYRPSYIISEPDEYGRYHFLYDISNVYTFFGDYVYQFSDPIEESYRQYVYAHYMTVETDVARQLQSINYDTFNSYGSPRYTMEVADGIRLWLANTCTYSTNPGPVPEGEDFVDYFINESHEGYCVYFATTAVMMFRSAGIPARYVEGYMVNPNSGNTTATDNGSYVVSVRDSAAHAWVEYYVDGVGWFVCDATPGYGEDVAPTTEVATEEVTTEDVTETPTEETTTLEETTTTEAATQEGTTEVITTEASILDEGDGVPISEVILKVIKIIGITIGGVAIFAFIIIFHYKKVDKFRKDVYNDKRVNAGRKKIIYDYYRAEKLLAIKKVIKDDGDTYQMFADKAVRAGFMEMDEAEVFVRLYEKAAFSQDDIIETQHIQFNKIILSMRDRILGNMGKIKRLWYVYIINI